MEEEWRPILGYDYEVSNLGNVRNKKGKIMKLQTNKDGYLNIIIRISNDRKTFKVHRLVLQTFLPIDEIKEVNHKNHIKTDNRFENLEWCSHSQNQRFRKKRKDCSSQYIGVSRYKNKWKSQCSFDGKAIYLGTFDTEEEGAKAYNNFVIKNGLQDFNLLNDIQL